MFNGARRMPEVGQNLGHFNDVVVYQREKKLRLLYGSLWFPNSRASLMSFNQSDLSKGKRGQVEPSKRMIFILGQLG